MGWLFTRAQGKLNNHASLPWSPGLRAGPQEDSRRALGAERLQPSAAGARASPRVVPRAVRALLSVRAAALRLPRSSLVPNPRL